MKNLVLSLLPEVFGGFAWSRGRCPPATHNPLAVPGGHPVSWKEGVCSYKHLCFSLQGRPGHAGFPVSWWWGWGPQGWHWCSQWGMGQCLGTGGWSQSESSGCALVKPGYWFCCRDAGVVIGIYCWWVGADTGSVLLPAGPSGTKRRPGVIWPPGLPGVEGNCSGLALPCGVVMLLVLHPA